MISDISITRHPNAVHNHGPFLGNRRKSPLSFSYRNRLYHHGNESPSSINQNVVTGSDSGRMSGVIREPPIRQGTGSKKKVSFAEGYLNIEDGRDRVEISYKSIGKVGE